MNDCAAILAPSDAKFARMISHRGFARHEARPVLVFGGMTELVGLGWLIEAYVECGLDDDQAKGAADATKARLLQRVHYEPAALPGRTRFSATLVKDPLVSFRRIVGARDDGLPLFDHQTNRLSEVGLTSVLTRSGLEPDVALAFAKVAVELIEPERFYQPIYEALGGRGPVDLPRLKAMDWTPLRPRRTDTDATEVAVRGAGPAAPRRRGSTVAKGPSKPRGR